jgi:hypothetical protein
MVQPDYTPFTDEELARIQYQINRMTMTGTVADLHMDEFDIFAVVKLLTDVFVFQLPRMIAVLRGQKQEIEALQQRELREHNRANAYCDATMAYAGLVATITQGYKGFKDDFADEIEEIEDALVRAQEAAR